MNNCTNMSNQSM